MDELLVKVDDYIEEHFGSTGLFKKLVDFMHLGSQRSDWEAKHCWLDEKVLPEEREALRATLQFNCHLVLGHTHHPRVRELTDGRFYWNTATAGTWEECVWTLELKKVREGDAPALVGRAALHQWVAGPGDVADDHRHHVFEKPIQ